MTKKTEKYKMKKKREGETEGQKESRDEKNEGIKRKEEMGEKKLDYWKNEKKDYS